MSPSVHALDRPRTPQSKSKSRADPRSKQRCVPSSDGWVRIPNAAAQIANAINNVLKPPGVGVIIKATHHCMTTRGVHEAGTDLVTSRMLGCCRDNELTRQECLGMAT